MMTCIQDANFIIIILVIDFCYQPCFRHTDLFCDRDTLLSSDSVALCLLLLRVDHLSDGLAHFPRYRLARGPDHWLTHFLRYRRTDLLSDGCADLLGDRLA